MSVNQRTIRANFIPAKLAKAHAAAHLQIGVKSNTPGMEQWYGSHLGRPQIIYDLNEQPLLYDFPVKSRSGKQLGQIRTAANKINKNAVLSTSFGGAEWDLRDASNRAQEIVRSKFKGEILRTRLVCYAYPKLGIMVYWRKKSETERTIIDIGDYSVVPERVEPGKRGPGAWSFYENIKHEDASKAAKEFSANDKLLDEIKERSRLDLSVALKGYEWAQAQQVVQVVLSLYTTKILTFCTHAYSHECFYLHPQINGYYCVVATGQMLLDFWRYNYTQDQIAHAMGTTAGGTGYAGEVNGYQNLTCSHFSATHDTTPTLAEARAEIDANRPFDYSYSYHAMACAGYRRLNFSITGIQAEYQLLIYDPSPVNTGTRRWETWGSGISAVDGFVYLRRP